MFCFFLHYPLSILSRRARRSGGSGFTLQQQTSRILNSGTHQNKHTFYTHHKNNSLCVLFHQEVRPDHQTLGLPAEQRKKSCTPFSYGRASETHFKKKEKNSIMKYGAVLRMWQTRYLGSRLSWHAPGTVGSRTTL